MNIIFIGTPQIATHYLEFLKKDNQIRLVITQSAKPSGRGLAINRSSVADFALANGLPLIETNDINSLEVKTAIKQTKAEASVVVAFGQLIAKEVRELVPGGFINLHFSLLPHLRGADPVAASIRQREAIAGVSTFEISDELDAGDIYVQSRIELDQTETTSTLFQKLLPLGEKALVETLNMISQRLRPSPQQGVASYAAKTNRTQYQIDWSLDALTIAALIRSGFEKKLAWTRFNDTIIKIESARVSHIDAFGKIGEVLNQDSILVQTGDGVLELLSVIPEGKNLMSAQQWVRGLREPLKKLI